MGYGELSFLLLLLPLSPQTRPPTALGKAEGQQQDWHGHVTAITVAPEYRRLGMARKMMDLIELVSDKVCEGYFVDLYVRCTNDVAIGMYEGMGYSVYRRVRDYYSASSIISDNDQDAVDAYGMPQLRYQRVSCLIPQQICGNH
jgi:N-terminal acetyltransferase B complex catalytic subunit